MVDLVKIRKKKAKQKEEAERDAVAPGARGGEPPVAADSPAPSAPPTQAAPSIDTVAADAVAASLPPADENPAPAAAEVPGSTKLDRFKSEAGRRRELDSKEAEEEMQHDGLLELLTFVIAGEHYAVDIERIVEIVTPRTVTRIPNADPTVVGILSLRGTIVTLVDVRRKLRHSTAGADTPETRIVVIDFRNEIVGFVVDRVLRVVKTDAAAIEPHPVVHANELDAAIRGVFRSGSALTILLDLDKLLDHNSLAGSTV